ncbi:MAG: hypothetical protein LBT86_02105 [Deltaproteobacteria bacterium]|nr:hypothetical protein [Deltaproteobacteria bacterium]
MANGSHTSRNVFIGIFVLIVISVGGWLYFQNSYSNEAYQTFAVAMDKFVGNDGQWKDGGHSFSLLDRSLTVNQLQISVFPPEAEPASTPASTESTDSTATTEPTKPTNTSAQAQKPLVFNVDQVYIKNGLLLNQLNKLFGLTDWRAQSETLIAEELTLKNIKFQRAEDNLKTDLLITSFQLKDLKLLSSPQDQVAGSLGFVKSVALASANIDKVSVSIEPARSEENYKLVFGPVKLENPRLGEGLTTTEDPIYLLKLFASLSCQQFQIQNFDLIANYPDKQNGQLIIKIADLFQQGVRTNGRVEKFNLKDFYFFLQDNTENIKVDAKLGSFEANGLDYSRLLKRISTSLENLVAKSIQDPTRSITIEDAMELYGGFYAFSNLFTLPYDLENASLANFSVSINDGLTFGVTNSSLSGPFKAGHIPLSQRLDFTAYLNLPTSLNPNDETLAAAYNIGQIFGQTNFNFKFDSALNYEPVSGTLQSTQNSLVADNLFALSSDAKIIGLTEPFITALDDISLLDFMAIRTIPDLLNVGVTNLRIDFQDQSLFPKIVKALAAFSNVEPQEISQRLKMAIRAWADEFLMANGVTNVGEVVQALELFVDQPQKLAIGLAPPTPFTTATVLSFIDDQSALLNALNIFLSVNGQNPIKLNWLRLTDPTPAESMIQEQDLLSD